MKLEELQVYSLSMEMAEKIWVIVLSENTLPGTLLENNWSGLLIQFLLI